MVDDAFISLRYSDRLLHGEGLTWAAGPPVEGYSNLLWVLLVAGLGACGLDLIDAARTLGVVASVATLVVLATCLPRQLPTLLMVVVLAWLTSFATWAIAGLETPLATLCVALLVVGMDRGHREFGPHRSTWFWFSGLVLAGLVLTRPDGPLWAVLAAASIFVCERLRERAVLRLYLPLLLPPVLAFVAQILFRLAYYDDWLPNTAYVKAHSSADSWRAGYAYVWSAAVALRSILLPALLGVACLLQRRSLRPTLVLSVLAIPVWCLYIASVGGDPLPRNRMLLPCLVPAVVLAAHGLKVVHGATRVGAIIAWCVALPCVGLAAFDAIAPSADPRQRTSSWEWEGEAVGAWLQRGFADRQPLLAVDAAGAVPYFSRLDCVDMLGLCDRTIARSPTDPSQGFWAGHTHGNGRYVLDREPDIVLFGPAAGLPQPNWLSGRQMEEDPRFLRDYRLALFEVGPVKLRSGSREGLRINAWLRLDGRAGLRNNGSLRVPGYLLGCYRQPQPFRLWREPPADPDQLARWQAQVATAIAWWQEPSVLGRMDEAAGCVVGEILRPGDHRVSGLQLAPGAYRLQPSDAPAGVEYRLLDEADGILPRNQESDWIVRRGHAEVTLSCLVSDTASLPLRVAEVVLQPVR